VAEPKRDKVEIFGEAARAAAGLSDSTGGPATQPRKKKSEPAALTADAPGSAPEQPAVATPATD
jgi:hypothetical protein